MTSTAHACAPEVIANTSPMHVLSEQQTIFVNSIVKGLPPVAAARAAGYSDPVKAGASLTKGKKIQEAIRFSYAKHAKAAQMSRTKVMDGLLEAINMAKLQADPGVMVNGWREIGRMCGYYAPEVKKIDISITTRRVVDELEALSDDDLLKLVDESGETIEGSAVRVLDSIQRADDAVRERDFGHFVP